MEAGGTVEGNDFGFRSAVANALLPLRMEDDGHQRRGTANLHSDASGAALRLRAASEVSIRKDMGVHW